jgi:phosphoadenosine phosphosulfate reductase
LSGASHSIWRDGRFRPDEWVRHTPDSALLAGDYPLLVALRDLLAEPERFLAHEGPLGIEVQAGEQVRELEPYLWKLTLIALVFPSFSDGRSYSAARLLRERLHYHGELRAVGDVLADQIPLMRRCGITSFEVRHAPTREALEARRLAEMHRFYQPIPTAPGEAPAGTRPWLRQPAGSD